MFALGAHRPCALLPWSLARPVLTFACSTWCVFVSSWPVFGSCFVAFRCITGLPSWHFSCMFAPGPRLRRGRDPGFLDLGTLLSAFISMLPFNFDLSLGPCWLYFRSIFDSSRTRSLFFFVFVFVFVFCFFFLSLFPLSCTSFPVPWRPSFFFWLPPRAPNWTPAGFLHSADSYRWCLLAAHTSFLSVINNC